MKIYTGKVRLFMYKLDDDLYEIGGKFDLFDDFLISDVSIDQGMDVLYTEISNNGWDMFDLYFESVLKDYRIRDVVEIVADTRLCYSTTGSYWGGEEVDLEASLENIKHRKLTKDQIERFAFDLLDRDDV